MSEVRECTKFYGHLLKELKLFILSSCVSSEAILFSPDLPAKNFLCCSEVELNGLCWNVRLI